MRIISIVINYGIEIRRIVESEGNTSLIFYPGELSYTDNIPCKLTKILYHSKSKSLLLYWHVVQEEL